MNQRHETFTKLNTQLAYLEDGQFQTLFDQAIQTTKGWGVNHVVELNKSKIFIKRIPLTEAIAAHPFATKNC